MIGPWSRRAIFCVGIGGAMLSAAAAVIWPALGIAGGLLTVAVILYQHFFAGPIVINFTTSDWERQDGPWVISISRREHGRRSPVATIGKWDDNGRWVEVWANARVGKDSTVHLILESGDPFDGQVRIA
jgi:hypothetical protein